MYSEWNLNYIISVILLCFIYFCFRLTKTSLCSSVQDNKDLELDIMPASLTDDPEVKLRDPNHEVNEEKRKSARKKEWVVEGKWSSLCI